jgi:hypothetical protein
MSITVLTLPKVNPELGQHIRVFKNQKIRILIGGVGIVFISGFLVLHVYKDIQQEVSAWYFHSTYVWLLVMVLASMLFLRQWYKIKKVSGVIPEYFKKLPNN